jgi:hypothetical protein
MEQYPSVGLYRSYSHQELYWITFSRVWRGKNKNVSFEERYFRGSFKKEVGTVGVIPVHKKSYSLIGIRIAPKLGMNHNSYACRHGFVAHRGNVEADKLSIITKSPGNKWLGDFLISALLTF